MKKLLFVLVLLSLGLTNNYLNAQTNVSGIISSNTTWAASGNPYNVTGNVMVNAGVTLTIEPGVIVKFDKLKSFQINGALIARGAADNNITFTSSAASPAAGDWGYLFFSDASTDAVFDGLGNYISGSVLEYCIVEYAGSGTNSLGAVQLTSSYPFINFCTIRNNNVSGIYAGGLTGTLKITNNTISNNSRAADDMLGNDGGAGIYISGGTVTISNNTIINNSVTYHGVGGGIFAKDGKQIITNNTFTNNTAAYDGGAMYIQSGAQSIISHNTIIGNTAQGTGGIYTLWGTATITDNIIYNNTGGMVIYYGGATISNNIITGNISGDGGSGIHIRGAAATISNNVISNNTVISNPYYSYGGGGILLGEYYTGMSVIITKNSIVNNTAENESAVDYNISYNGSFNEDFNYNTIAGNKSTGTDTTYTIRMSYLPPIHYNNIFNNTAKYELYNTNGNSTTLDAKNNWWGTTVDAQIADKIFDWMEDASVGIVNYSSYLTALDTAAPMSPPVNVTKTDLGGGQIKVTWNRNQEGDIAGYRIYAGGYNGYSFTNAVDVGNDTTFTLTSMTLSKNIGVTAYDKNFSAGNDDPSTIVNDNMTNGNESWFTLASTVTGITEGADNLPGEYKLIQNYPNPFNPSTTINYSIAKDGYVSLSVYNAIGCKVATIVNGYKPAGNYSVQFNGNNLASGIYFYRLESGNFSAAKKFILMK
jgi:parallel beta-helix repeat protein